MGEGTAGRRFGWGPALPRRPAPIAAVAAPPHRPDVAPARPDALGAFAAPGPDQPAAAAQSGRSARRIRVTFEGLLYVGLLVAAALTRFWDLGRRALHHDESLHAYYSWLFATGGGYVHDPLMHGPFLFHANALVYLLFGATDATSRFMPALFGTVLVGLPWLLRSPRLLGRWGALATSALFLISPAILYYSRYIRHDIYTVVGALVLFIGIVRYVERPERRWLVVGGVSLGFLFANHEIVFAIVAVFALFLGGCLLWGRLRPLAPLAIGGALLAGAVVVVGRRLTRPLPVIPWDRTGIAAPLPTRANQIAFYRDLLTHPLVLTLLALLVATLVGAGLILRRMRPPDRSSGLVEALLGDAPAGSVEAAVAAAWRDKLGLAWAVLAGFALFAALFTTLFTHLGGLATGTIATDGTLLYWLGQQGVRRGEQPWFYFLLLTPEYELFAVVFGLTGAALTLWRAWRGRRTGRPDPRAFCRLFLVVWLAAIVLGLSYAGEKMPWLVVHIALPALLLAGSFLGELAEALTRRRLAAPAWLVPGLTAALVGLAGGWFLIAGRPTYPVFVNPGGRGWIRQPAAGALADWWQMALPLLAVLGLLALAWVWRGKLATARAATLALVLVIALYQIHSEWRLAYLEGDVPKDSLIYNTTSPDVTRVVGEIGTLSAELTGGKGLPIWYDTGGNGAAWPFNWYLRDFPNKRGFAGYLSGPPVNDPAAPAIVIVANTHLAMVQPSMTGYTPQQYVLRWHEPEAQIYRNFAIAPELRPGRSAWRQPGDPHGPIAIAESVGSSLATQLQPAGQQRVYRLVMYRELPAGTMRFDFTIFVRNDLLPLWDSIRY